MADDAGSGFIHTRDVPITAAPPADEIRRLLSDLRGRVDGPTFRRPEDLAALAGALERLARKVASNRELASSTERSLSASIEALARRVDGQAMAQARLAAQLADIETRMDQRLGVLLEEISAARTHMTVPSPPLRGPRMALAAGGLLVALGVLAAVGLFLSQAAPAPDPRLSAPSAQEHPSL